MMRSLIFWMLAAALVASCARAQDATEADGNLQCPAGNNLAEIDMQLLESDLTLEAALQSAKRLEEWLPRYNPVNNRETHMAVHNHLMAIEGYHLKQLVLMEEDPSKREPARIRFCEFMSKAIYYD